MNYFFKATEEQFNAFVSENGHKYEYLKDSAITNAEETEGRKEMTQEEFWGTALASAEALVC